MEKVYIIDYLSFINEDRQPVGHVKKILSEYSKILINKNIVFVISKYYKENYMINYRLLRTKTYVNKKKKNRFLLFIEFSKKIFLVLKLLIFFNRGSEWFVNIDIKFFIALYLCPKIFIRNKNIYITLYKQKYTFKSSFINKIANKIFTKSQKKITHIFKSNIQISSLAKSTYVPDYFYNESFYSKFLNVPKNDQYVCLGTMNSHKNLEELVRIFLKSKKKLTIIGNFYDLTRYDKLKKLVSGHSNIIINNVYLKEEEYYRLIAESKFSIMPYKENIYSKRTSGILIESIFLRTIPIAPKYLLDYNGIRGIDYNILEEFVKKETEYITNNIIEENNKIINEHYRIKNIERRINNVFVEDK